MAQTQRKLKFSGRLEISAAHYLISTDVAGISRSWSKQVIQPEETGVPFLPEPIALASYVVHVAVVQ